ncbi:MAG: hypothetical protein AAF235_10810 [Planctomycetota bacterium]
MSDARICVLTAAALCVALVGGCGDALQGERPSEVRVQRVITTSGERIVSYTAMFDDGVETYVDLQPQGDVDLITVERDGQDKLRFVREGASVRLPADGPDAAPLDDAWERRFAAIDGLVSVDRVPWSDGHGGITPAELRVAPLPASDTGP